MPLRAKLLFLATTFLLVASFVLAREIHALPGVDDLPVRLAARMDASPHATWLPLSLISLNLQTAVVLSEDSEFYSHHGLAYGEIEAAFFEDLRTHRYARGGSTITQQVVRTLYLTPDKSIERKIREAMLARRLEQTVSKDRILEIYLNIADWGDGITGAQEASRFYFQKNAGDLDWPEAAMLAAILRNPHRYNPYKNPEAARRLRDGVLARLLEAKDIAPGEFWRATREPVPRGR
jgi:membrane peptidoglycan carboxypeptidase